MKKLLIFAFILGLIAANFILVKPANATSIHDNPWCNLVFWRDGYCDDDDDYSPAPAPAPAPAPTPNQAPVWTTGQTAFNITAGNLLQFTVNAYDPNNDPITYGVSFLPIGSTFDNNTKTFAWTPTNNQTGTYMAQFSAHDGKTYSYLSISINVSPVSPAPVSAPAMANQKPVFVNFAPLGKGKVEVLYSYDVNAIDSDNDPLTYSVLTAPIGLIINTSTGLITWTPSALQTNFNYVQAAVSDGKSQTVQDFYIFVDGPNVTPTPSPTPNTQPPVNPSTRFAEASARRAGSGQIPIPAPEARIVFSDIKFENDDGEIWASWTTDIPSGSRVIYDIASQADRTRNFTYANATPDDRNLVTGHWVKIGKLESETVYYLRLVSKTDQQVAVSNEIVFVLLEDGRINSLFGATLFDILGPLLTNAFFLWLLIIASAITAFFFYRKLQKANSPL